MVQHGSRLQVYIYLVPHPVRRCNTYTIPRLLIFAVSGEVSPQCIRRAQQNNLKAFLWERVIL